MEKRKMKKNLILILLTLSSVSFGSEYKKIGDAIDPLDLIPSDNYGQLITEGCEKHPMDNQVVTAQYWSFKTKAGNDLRVYTFNLVDVDCKRIGTTIDPYKNIRAQYGRHAWGEEFVEGEMTVVHNILKNRNHFIENKGKCYRNLLAIKERTSIGGNTLKNYNHPFTFQVPQQLVATQIEIKCPNK